MNKPKHITLRQWVKERKRKLADEIIDREIWELEKAQMILQAKIQTEIKIKK